MRVKACGASRSRVDSAHMRRSSDADDWGKTARISGFTARYLLCVARWCDRRGAHAEASRIRAWGETLANMGEYGETMERASRDGRAAPGGDA